MNKQDRSGLSMRPSGPVEKLELHRRSQVLAAPHNFIQQNHRALGSSQPSTDFRFAVGRRMNHVVKAV